MAKQLDPNSVFCIAARLAAETWGDRRIFSVEVSARTGGLRFSETGFIEYRVRFARGGVELASPASEEKYLRYYHQEPRERQWHAFESDGGVSYVVTILARR